MPNRFYVQPMNDYSQGFEGFGESISKIDEGRRIKQAQKDETDRIDTMQKGAFEAFKSKDPAKMQEFIFNNPEMSKVMNDAWSRGDEQVRSQKIGQIFEALIQGDPENPEYKNMEMEFAAIAKPEEWKRYQDMAKVDKTKRDKSALLENGHTLEI